MSLVGNYPEHVTCISYTIGKNPDDFFNLCPKERTTMIVSYHKFAQIYVGWCRRYTLIVILHFVTLSLGIPIDRARKSRVYQCRSGRGTA